MNLGQLLADLVPLLEDPEQNGAAIRALLERHTHLAEYEVARFFAAETMQPHLSTWVRALNPEERLLGARLIGLVCTNEHAAQLLRRIAKDPDPRVRQCARTTLGRLHLRDVALPDTRFRPHPKRGHAFDTSGWTFGIHFCKNNGKLRKDRLDGHGLPQLATRADVAKLVGLDGAESLSRHLRPGARPGSAYIEFDVPKATGGTRRIAAPRRALRAAQRTILREILAKVPVHAAAHGFVAERSTVTNARAHRGAAVILKTDLQDFFPTIHYRRVAGLFEQLGYPSAAALALAGLCTYRPLLSNGDPCWPGLLPQGAPSSPAVTNLICRRLDARLTALAAKIHATYTRYADDITFSFVQEPQSLGRIFWWIDQICQQEGFSENTKKRRIYRRSSQQRITGIVVNDGLTVPRSERRRFRAILANVKKNGLEVESRGRSDFAAYLHGFASYVRMVQPDLGARLARDVREAIAHAPR